MVELVIESGLDETERGFEVERTTASPPDSLSASFPSNHCEMCGKQSGPLHEHHTIPRSLGGEDEDIIYVCPHCHKKADWFFENMIVSPFMRGSGKKHRIYSYVDGYQKKNHIWKVIDAVVIDDMKFGIYMFYNLRSKNIIVYTKLPGVGTRV